MEADCTRLYPYVFAPLASTPPTRNRMLYNASVTADVVVRIILYDVYADENTLFRFTEDDAVSVVELR
jgi:hypothetical protein